MLSDLVPLNASPFLNGTRRSPLGRFAAGWTPAGLAGPLDLLPSLPGQAAVALRLRWTLRQFAARYARRSSK